MIVGMLSDAHGNVEGFAAGLSSLRRLGATRIFFLGDAVGYLPGSAVVDAIDAAGVEAVAGNHEAMLLDEGCRADEAVFGFGATRRALGADGLRRVAGWPHRRVLDTRVGPVLFVHDSPWPDHRRIYPDTDLGGLPVLPWSIVCMGHTHRPFVRDLAGTTLVNVGSCGLPRDDGRLGAVATLDTVTGAVRIVRFDLRAATEQALARVGPVAPVVRASIDRRECPHETARSDDPRFDPGGRDD